MMNLGNRDQPSPFYLLFIELNRMLSISLNGKLKKNDEINVLFDFGKKI